jgi:hypothetical protein
VRTLQSLAQRSLHSSYKSLIQYTSYKIARKGHSALRIAVKTDNPTTVSWILEATWHFLGSKQALFAKDDYLGKTPFIFAIKLDNIL